MIKFANLTKTSRQILLCVKWRDELLNARRAPQGWKQLLGNKTHLLSPFMNGNPSETAKKRIPQLFNPSVHSYMPAIVNTTNKSSCTLLRQVKLRQGFLQKQIRRYQNICPSHSVREDSVQDGLAKIVAVEDQVSQLCLDLVKENTWESPFSLDLTHDSPERTCRSHSCD